MPSSRAALRLTDAYRRAQVAVRNRAMVQASRLWSAVDVADIDASVELVLPALVAIVATAKHENAAASPAYLARFVALELDEEPRPPAIVEDRSARSATGEPLANPIARVAWAMKWAIGNGYAPRQAKTFGRARVLMITANEVVDAGRDALLEAMRVDERVAGYERVVYGTCGACLGRQGQRSGKGQPFRRHRFCKCVTEPVVKGAPQSVARPSGEELFARLPKPEQDVIGLLAAEAIRRGAVKLSQLSTVEAGVLTQRPLGELLPADEITDLRVPEPPPEPRRGRRKRRRSYKGSTNR